MSDMYSRAWRVVAAAILLGATLVGCLSGAAVATLSFFLIFAVITASAVVAMHLDPDHPNGGPTPSVRLTLRHAVTGGLWGTGVVGLIHALGGFGVLLTLLLVATAPFVVRQFTGRQPQEQQPEREARVVAPRQRTEASPSGSDVAAMSTPDLIRAWRSSYTTLNRARSVREKARIADRRQQYIDELERRDRAGFERWLMSGARAASDPSKFLGSSGGGTQLPEAS